MSAFQFDVPETILDAMIDVRADTSETNFMVATWDTPTSLKLEGTGSGGLAEMKSMLPSNDVAYGLLREKFNWESVGDVSADTIKFIFVYWFPDSGVPLMRKMKVGTFEGQIRKLFEQYHADIMAGNDGEFTEDIVKTLLENITGKADHTTEAREAPKAAKFERKFIGGMDGKTQDIAFVDEGALREAISSVRDNEQPDVDFVVADFDMSSKKPALKLKEVGGGGLDALKAVLAGDQFNYGFVRITETIDQTEAVKFCFIKSQPEATSFKAKGKLGLLGGAVSNVFHPYHGDVFIDEVGDLKMDEVVLATKKR
mmetsp:Transcript_16441/g.33881  ORF Transcript_16441/g.33881 Transcript_16441/m.33881 type:complete len:313 (+) Transcript_16441:78-1016(+)